MSRGRSGKRGLPDDGWGGFGGYMKAKTMKLSNQFEQDIPRNVEKAGISSTIFNGVSIHVNGYTDPPAEKLKQMMMTHGGKYIYYPNKTNTTHIIASNLAYTKIKELKNEKVVTPNWITDSIKAGKLLPYADYLLYRPKASNQTIHRFAAGNSSSTVEDGEPLGAAEGFSQPVIVPASVDEEGRIGEGAGQEDVCKTDKSIPGGVVEPCRGGDSFNRLNQTDSNLSKEENRDTVIENPSVPSHQGGKVFPKSGASNFLSEFYTHSRLHYISTWGAEYKAFVNELQRTGDRSFPGRQKLKALLSSKELLTDSGSSSNIQGSLNGCNEAAFLSENVKNDVKGPSRIIMHIDMDCFFVSVSLLKYPELRGKPVAVTHSKGQSMPETNRESREYERAYYEKKMGTREGFSKHDEMGKDKVENGEEDEENGARKEEVGETAKENSSDQPKQAQSSGNHSSFNSMAEIASCSYEARQAGVKNGMFMGRARELCPELKTIPYDFEGYQRVSRHLYETVASYTHDIEAVSCDEMLVDISNVLEDTGVAPLEFARVLREEVFAKTECHASTGLASSILLARLATKVAKPNGMFFLEEEKVEEFMKEISVRDLPGVGWSTNRKLRENGVTTCADLQAVPLSTLQKDFGSKTGQQLYQHCRGQDDRPIRMERERKSVSAEVNYGIRFKGEDEHLTFISNLAEEVHKRLRNLDMVGRTITVKLKVRQEGAPKEPSKFMGHGICDDKARSITLGQETDDLAIIQKESKALLLQMRVAAQNIRGVGIQISRLVKQSNQSGGSKSILDMLPKKSDVSKPSQMTSAFENDSNKMTSPLSMTSKSKPKTTSLMDFVTKQSPGKKPLKINLDSTCQKKESSEPRLPTLESPPSSQTALGNLQSASVKPSIDAFHLPSPSQLDLSVLQSLPPDIRSQIMREYKKTGAFGEPSGQGTTVDSNQASTSTGITSSLDPEVLQNLPPEIQREVLENERFQRARLETVVQNLGPVEELPSFSQIDPSCMEALPTELKNELHSAYQRKVAPAVKPLPRKSPSPRKQATPVKRKGHPKKGSPGKLANQKPSWQRNIFEALNIPESPSKMEQAEKREEKEIERGRDRKDEEEIQRKEDLREKSEIEKNNKDVASLGGAVELKDVKALLREWIDTFNNPLEEDVKLVVQYMRELILERNLEMVHYVLKALKRIVSKSTSRGWKDACSTIITRVQTTVEQVYGSTLKME